MKNSAAYVGRVGGLAVALGIGTAVFTGQGVAMADSSEGASGPASNDASETKSGTANAGTTPSSGGAQTGSKPSTTGAKTTTDDSTTSTPTDGGSTTDPSDTEPAASDPATDTPTSKPATRGSRHSSLTPRSSTRDDKKSAAGVGARPAVSETGGTAQPSSATETQARDANSVRRTVEPTSTVTKLSVPDSQAAGRQAAQAMAANDGEIATTALTSVALASPTTTDPVAPVAPAPSLFGFLQLAWRELTRGFVGSGSSANQRPTITYDVADSRVVNGTLVGRVTATDPDSTLKLTASRPAHGEVVVNPDGTFTYTPDPTYTGRDSFRITATEMSSGNTGGLAGLIRMATFGLFGGGNRSASTTITVGDGFTSSTVVSGLNSPTDFRFLPDGRILFAEKGGAIKATNKDGQLQSTPLITLPSSTVWARGVNGIEVDPHYEQNGYIYVSYIRSDNYQRLSRLTVTDPAAEVLTVDPASEVVLVQGTDPAGNDHHGGGLSFGPDGKLYWSTGDNVCCSVTDGRNSQDLSNIYGKVLRLNPDGSAPSDNPFYDGDGPNQDAIYATGFRNPFRLAFTPDGKLLVGDVGQAKWEEVNLVTAGANYGWPNAEGPCDGIGTTNCATPSSYANPIYAYRHTSGGNSITAVMGYAGLSANGQKTVLIADFNQGWVKKLTFNADYSALIGEATFDVAASGATSKLAQGPDGSIYQLTYDGKLTRIAPAVGALA
jgi:glucose/arabinose dehydrogenase